MQKIANATTKKKRNPLRFRPINIVLQSMSSKTVPTPRQIPPYSINKRIAPPQGRMQYATQTHCIQSINKSHRRRGVLHTPLQLAQNQSCENYIGHRKNYVLCRKNYIRHNSNYIRPFFAACKHMKNNSLQNHILIEQLFINQVVVKSPHSSPQIISNTPETHIVPFKGLQQEITDVFVTWGMGKTLPEAESAERFPQQAACRLFP